MLQNQDDITTEIFLKFATKACCPCASGQHAAKPATRTPVRSPGTGGGCLKLAPPSRPTVTFSFLDNTVPRISRHPRHQTRLQHPYALARPAFGRRPPCPVRLPKPRVPNPQPGSQTASECQGLRPTSPQVLSVSLQMSSLMTYVSLFFISKTWQPTL